MSRLEWTIWIVSHACIVLAYYYLVPLWKMMNDATTSFVAEFYWIPILLMGSGCVTAVFMNIGIYEVWSKKRKAK
jgi:hypothetical protein